MPLHGRVWQAGGWSRAWERRLHKVCSPNLSTGFCPAALPRPALPSHLSFGGGDGHGLPRAQECAGGARGRPRPLQEEQGRCVGYDVTVPRGGLPSRGCRGVAASVLICPCCPRAVLAWQIDPPIACDCDGRRLATSQKVPRCYGAIPLYRTCVVGLCL